MNETFLTIIRRHLKYLPADAEIGPDSRLRDHGLDSMAAVTLMLDLEDEFGTEIPDSELVDRAFETPASLWAALNGLPAAP